MKTRTLAFLLAASMICAYACGCGDDDNDDNGGTSEVTLPANASDVVTNYSAIVHANYEDSLASAKVLDEKIDAFLAAPSAEGLEEAKEAWLAAREPYLQTEVFRFYDGPIDHPEDGPEGLINAWPMDENYIDYVMGDDAAGIVSGSDTIDAATLEGLNEAGGEKNIATGFHAIEFLLWGQDLSEDGPGNRPHTDFLTDDNDKAERRALYLSTVSDMLVGHLQSLTDAWATGEDNYRKSFEAEEAKEGVRRILTGMIVLSGFETGGERLQTALDSGDQEDEHSCFSDNTHRDMVQDAVGVLNVWNGSYKRLDGSTVSGTGIKAMVEEIDTELAGTLDTKIKESVTLAEALQPPFDQEIAVDNADGRARVQALITSLRSQEKDLERVFTKLGLTIPDPE